MRTTLTESNTAALALQLGFLEEQVTDQYRPRWKVVPTDEDWVLRLKREERKLLPAK